ncbi:hypothetical protein [Ramlibacter algicola]|uniref:Lipoprotein n=1 Tax=Ramlibacter algicola TaxID=2795217 RepID=A0A934Q3P6_9BURK|nr:hypothetical protein [Ramlibacter algicola]MBK0394486.1 hypothetical protein [Ramlibacter algicola]
MKHAILLAACAFALAACGDKPQTLRSGNRPDTSPSQGTGVAAFQAGTWKAGDKAAWEQQMKVRAAGQNDYVKVN